MTAWLWWFLSPMIWLAIASLIGLMWARIKMNRQKHREAFDHFYNTTRYHRDF